MFLVGGSLIDAQSCLLKSDNAVSEKTRIIKTFDQF